MRKAKQRAFTGVGFGLAVCFLFAVLLKVDFRSVIVEGQSMLPSLNPGERVVVSSAYWLVGGIRDKDIVVLKDPTASDGYIIKRVFRMGGETVPVDKWPEYRRLDEGPYVVPPGNVYVLGDNLPQSEDSRKFGAQPLSHILGKVVIRP